MPFSWASLAVDRERSRLREREPQVTGLPLSSEYGTYKPVSEYGTHKPVNQGQSMAFSFRQKSLEHFTFPLRSDHTVEFEGFVGSKFRALRDQFFTTSGPKANCVMQVDF